jgi:hypothetical protein
MHGSPPGPPATPRPHPHWCKLERCQTRNGGFHTSEAVHVAFDRRAGSTARLRLRLYALDVGFPMLEILMAHLDGTPRARVDLGLNDATALHHALAMLLARTGPISPTLPDTTDSG